MTPLQQIAALENRAKAGEMVAYHKTTRPVLGVSNGDIDQLVKGWKADATPELRLQIAHDLWSSRVFEACIAAAKLLTQARMQNDTEVWAEIQGWVPAFDGWAIADHASKAGEKRLQADPRCLDQVEDWTRSDHMWTRRAALVMTLPWAKIRNPKPADIENQERILGWAAGYTTDHNWFIQKAIGWWLRTLSEKSPDRTRAFIAQYGEAMKPFARREALRKLG